MNWYFNKVKLLLLIFLILKLFKKIYLERYGSGKFHQPLSVDEYFRRIYYFNQPGFKAYNNMETLLLNALKPGIDVTDCCVLAT